VHTVALAVGSSRPVPRQGRRGIPSVSGDAHCSVVSTRLHRDDECREHELLVLPGGDAMKTRKQVIKVDFDAHRHTDAVMREVLGPTAFVGVANDRAATFPEDNEGMLPGMAAWKAAYEAKQRRSA